MEFFDELLSHKNECCSDPYESQIANLSKEIEMKSAHLHSIKYVMNVFQLDIQL